MNINYFFTLVASLTLPSLSNIQASVILRSTTAKFDSRRYLSPFCFADLSCTRHNQSKLCFCSRFGKVHSVTMHRISFADTAASRQSKQARSALDFCSVSFADLAGVRQLKQASLLSLMQGYARLTHRSFGVGLLFLPFKIENIFADTELNKGS